jgi:NitT/TauT family transport system permease protein
VNRTKQAFIITSGALFVVLFVFLVGLLVAEPLVMPPAGDVMEAFSGIITTQMSLVAMTLLRLVLVLAFASVSGIALGLLAGIHPVLKNFLMPMMTILRTLPVISVIVVVLVVAGFSMTPYVVTFAIIMPVLYQATADAVEATDQAYVDVFLLESANLKQRLLRCHLPLIIVALSTATLHAVGLGIKVLVMTEYLSQTPDSVGYALFRAKTDLRYDRVFAWTLVLVILVLVIEWMVTKAKKRHTAT